MKHVTSPRFSVGDTVEHYVSSPNGRGKKRSVARVSAVEGNAVLVIDAETRKAVRFAPRKTDGLYVAPRNANTPTMPDYIFRVSSAPSLVGRRAA